MPVFAKLDVNPPLAEDMAIYIHRISSFQLSTDNCQLITSHN